MLEIVLFSFDVAADGVCDAAVGSEREGGDFLVDVLEGFVEILRASLRQEKTAECKKDQSAETREPNELA